MIAIFDEDGGGDVDFQEFVSGLSAFSSKGNKQEKLHFAFKVYDIDRDGYISNGELFIVLKMMVGSNLKDMQLQQIVDKTMMEADLDGDGKISFEEFTRMVENTDVSTSMTLGEYIPFRSSSRIERAYSCCMGANWSGQINSNLSEIICYCRELKIRSHYDVIIGSPAALIYFHTTSASAKKGRISGNVVLDLPHHAL